MAARLDRKGQSELNAYLSDASFKAFGLTTRADSLIEARTPGWEGFAELLPELARLSSALGAASTSSLLLHVTECDSDREILRGVLATNLFIVALGSRTLEAMAERRAPELGGQDAGFLLAQTASIRSDVDGAMERLPDVMAHPPD